MSDALQPVHHHFPGRLVMVGFGCIGQGVLPLLLRHIDMRPEQVLVITRSDRDRSLAAAYGVRLEATALHPGNHREVLKPLLGPGDFLLNLSVNVSSAALIRLCGELGALYLDTCIEPWDGGYTDPRLSLAARTNYALREEALACGRAKGAGPTAVLAHGANPGLVSHFLKQALFDVARDTGAAVAAAPASGEGWATLAMQLGVRSIHVAERDTQVGRSRKPAGSFFNTWSVEGFVDEACCQPAELGWGTHERHFPPDGARHEQGCLAAIYLRRPGASTRVRTWTPRSGAFHGFLVTHAESISIADHLTLGPRDRPLYRPTVHYAYHPCDDAVLSLHELAGREWRMSLRAAVLRDEITEGVDELGVLLMGHARGAYWLGSQLSIEQARQAAPLNSATGLQVTAAVMAGVIWAMKNPARGVVEPDDLPHDQILGWCRPYLGDVVGCYTDWTPLQDRNRLFPEDIDASDPWQFSNVRVG
ncbi:homospermidine synthase [Ideonella sp. YS5]|uniref:homospermidine synthase n=1 Tax=Ideonella sp. YS5 TaxID=3453714 RepID=UPI003EEF5E01